MHNTNPVIVENGKDGTADWQLNNPASLREIEGYASATSLNRGESIALYVNTKAEYYSYAVYRMGWYQGFGARLVLGPITARGTEQIIPAMESGSGLVDCNWENPVILATTDSDPSEKWSSGIYLVKLTEQLSNKQSYIIFALRDDARKADLLFQQSVTTYQAYNNWGGKSLYKWNSTDNKRASKISFNRPYAGNQQNPAAAYGIGAGEFLCNVQPNNPEYPISNAGWEINMLRWLEREGYDVAYCTNLDVHEKPELLFQYKAFLSVGHDEYWSWEMRNHLERALESGLNLGFFSANTGYWQIRFESSEVSQQKHRIMVCHKSAKRDPYAKQPDRQYLTTCKWREYPLDMPESSLLGVMYAADPVDCDIVIQDSTHWVFNGTGLVNGDRLCGLLGYEVDAVSVNSPANLQILAVSPWQKLNEPQQHGNAHMTVYQHVQDAWVFAIGSIQWSWGLDDFNAPVLRSSRVDSVAQQITRNVLNKFIAHFRCA